MYTMRHDKRKVLLPAVITMVVLHLSSVVLGTIFPLLFSQRLIVNFSVVLFLVFGVLMLYDAYRLEEKSSREKVNELEEELVKENPAAAEPLASPGKEASSAQPQIVVTEPAEESDSSYEINPSNGLFTNLLKSPYAHLVLLLFVGECGDRTQIAAIVLTATHSAWGVAVGGSLVLC